MDKFQVEKIYKNIKQGDTLKDVSNRFDISDEEVFGLVELLNTYGKNIEIFESEGTLYISKKTQYRTKKINKPHIEDLIETKICVISDTHFGASEQQLSLVNKVYKLAYEKEIAIVLHCGDMLDGDYTKIRPTQNYNLFLRGFDEQSDYIVDMYPEIRGITTHFIQGSHDETHLKNGGASAGKKIASLRKDMIYEGQDNATVVINKIKIEMDHPGGGCSEGLSYKPQKAIEKLQTGNKPHIFLQGHYHKKYDFVYHNVYGYLVPCLTDKSGFMIKMKLPNIVGAYYFTIYSDEKGNIQYIRTEEYPIKESDIIKNDFLKCKRLVIK